MNRTKRIAAIVLAGMALLVLLALLVFTARTRYPGGFTISVVGSHSETSANIVATTPFGRHEQYAVPPEGFFLSGFYRSAEIEFTNLNDSLVVWVEYKSVFYKYVLTPDPNRNTMRWSIPVEDNYRISFFKKLFTVSGWLLGLAVVQQLLAALLAVAVLLLLLFWFRAMRRRAKTQETTAVHRVTNHLLAFVSGLFFWLFATLLLIEIALRIFGSFYSSINTHSPADNTDYAYTILCIGDSFTYGIGAPQRLSYPEQLQGIVEENTQHRARVINAGICAGNTTQMLEQVQGLLNQYRPDAVVMLFGMANSWNYYGFTQTNSFLHRIKIYKLYKRIRHNIDYRRNGFEMFQRVNDFSRSILVKSVRVAGNKNKQFDFCYQSGRYQLSTRNWQAAMECFAAAASLSPFNDSVRHALWVCIEKNEADTYFTTQHTKAITDTVLAETTATLAHLQKQYAEAPDLAVIHYRYLATKGQPAKAVHIIDSLIRLFPHEAVLFADRMLYGDSSNIEETALPQTAALYCHYAMQHIENNNLATAWQYFDSATMHNPHCAWAIAAKNCIDIVNSPRHNRTDGDIATVESAFETLLTLSTPENIESDYANQLFPVLGVDKNRLSQLLASHNNRLAEIYLLQLILQRFFHFIENQHEDFFLIHRNKRSMDLKDAEVFAWIENDINTIVDICLKQHYRVICMNYPIIPPPVSEEMLYWAAQTGEIWRRTASKKGISFIDNDSIFDLYGEQKHSLFEPAFTGSEHCNEKGYNLMAENIYNVLIQQGIIKPPTKP